MTYTKRLLIAAALLIALAAQNAYAVAEWRSGIVQTVYADPADAIVILAGVPGPCGSTIYQIPRTNVNFKEFYALMLTAFVAKKTVNLFVAACVNDRNMLSHGNASD